MSFIHVEAINFLYGQITSSTFNFSKSHKFRQFPRDDALNKALRKSKHRGLAVTKRGGVVGVNDGRHGISIKELATLY